MEQNRCLTKTEFIQELKLSIERGDDVNCKNNGVIPIIYASEYCTKGFVEVLLDRGANVNSKGHVGVTPLILASKLGRFNLAKLLISHGADVNLRDDYGKTALMHAAECDNPKQKKIIKLLLSHEADVNVGDKTALMRASELGADNIVKILISHGADINAKDDDGITAIMWAIDRGRMSTIKLLREHGAELMDELKVTPFYKLESIYYYGLLNKNKGKILRFKVPDGAYNMLSKTCRE